MNAIRQMLAAPLTLLLAELTCLLYLQPAWGIPLEVSLEHSTGASLLTELPSWLGCHLLHWSGEHLLWDLGMFVLLGYYCEPRFGKTYLVTLLLAALAIPWSIHWLQPEVSSYRGLSGLDTAIFSLLAVTMVVGSWRSGDRQGLWLFGSLLVALAGKVAFEFTSGGTLFVSQVNFVPLPLAHVVGGLIGGLLAISQSVRAEWPQPPAIASRSLSEGV